MQMNNALEITFAIVVVLFCIGVIVIGFFKDLSKEKNKDGDL